MTATNESDTDNKVKGRGKGEKLNMNCTKRTQDWSGIVASFPQFHEIVFFPFIIKHLNFQVLFLDAKIVLTLTLLMLVDNDERVVSSVLCHLASLVEMMSLVTRKMLLGLLKK